MTEPGYRLRRDVVVEPLVARWYAWTHLIAPATSALHVVHRHIKMMESYVAMPAVHAAAARDPALLGGPFLDLDGARVDDVRALLAWTLDRQQPARQLAADLAATWKLLAREADGHGLAGLYERLPAALRGTVELVYTPAGAPDLRLIEALLYRTPAHDPTLQGAMIRRAGDHRAFALSTPRLDRPDAIYLHRPFVNDAYDLLGALRDEPRPLPEIADALQVGPDRLALLESFLTTQEPPPRARARAARWRYFGHACVLIETAGGQSVLVDPVIAYATGEAPERFTAADLPARIDHVVITHNHPDHVVLETLLALRWKIGTVLVPAGGGSLADPSLRLALEAIGFADVREVPCLAQVVAGDVRIRALPFLGEHADLDIRTKATWLIEAEGMRLLFAADANNLDPVVYDRLAPLIGRVDTLFIGMECHGAPMSWMYGCLLPAPVERAKDQSRRLDGSDFARARAIVASLDVARICVYALGLEPWLTFISSLDPRADSPALRESQLLINHCHTIGRPAERLYGRAEAVVEPRP